MNLAEIRSMRIEKINPENQAVASGMVKASVEFVIYSSKEPQARLQLDSINRWLTGRYNIFREAGPFAPVQELEKYLHVSPGNSDTQGNTDEVTAGNSMATEQVTIVTHHRKITAHRNPAIRVKTKPVQPERNISLKINYVKDNKIKLSSRYQK